MKFNCAHCGKKAEQPNGAVTRARKLGRRLFCDRRCAGLAKRKHKTKAQRVREKHLYDIEYRKRNRALLKAKKRAYFLRTYHPEKARIERKKKMPRHVEYCRRPEYRRWKKGYDHQYRAEKVYGPFADAWVVLDDLRREIKTRSTGYEIRQQNGTLNKTQSRRRESEAPRRYGHRAA